MQRAYVSLGSNLGDREAFLADAIVALAREPHVEVVATSRVYETDPLGPPPQRAYLNAAAALDCGLTAPQLLALLQRIEADAGRDRRGARWTARTLDLDLLFFGDQRIEEPGLVVPHPRMHERGFVLEPLSEIAAEVVHPVSGSRVAELAARQRDPRAVRPYSDRPLEEQEEWQSQP